MIKIAIKIVLNIIEGGKLMIFDVIENNLPAWYELETTEEGIIIKINKMVLPLFRQTRINPLDEIDSFTKEQLPEFTGSEERDWGFGEALSLVEQDDQWASWLCRFLGRKNRRGLLAAAASLSVLFRYLSLIEKKTDCVRSQLLVVLGLVVGRFAGSALSVLISPKLCLWTSQQKDKSKEEEMISEMMRVHTQMHGGLHLYRREEFIASFCGSRRIYLACPGRECDLSPRNQFPESGYELISHNVDSTIQQLTLLTGIAKLYQLAKKDLF